MCSERCEDKKGTLIFGLGRSGLSVLEYLMREPTGEPVWVIEENKLPPEVMARFEPLGVRFIGQAGDLSAFTGFCSLVVSPGVNAREARFDVLRSAGVEILSELEFAWRLLPEGVRVVAVTGTNGKSTTVSLIHHLLVAAGRKSLLAGNIGIPLTTELAGLSDTEFVVLEVSSFQLEEIHRFRPDVGLILNLTPDHLDRYPDEETYYQAKLDGFRNQNSADFLIVNADDERLRELLHRPVDHRARVIGFTRQRKLGTGAFMVGSRMQVNLNGETEMISTTDMKLKGVHNIENSMAAVLAVELLGLHKEEIEKGLRTFEGLVHRVECVGRLGGIEFINDSKATNVDATEKSLLGFPFPVALILGGKDKGGDFARLLPLIEESCALVMLIGQASDEIARQLVGSRVSAMRVKSLREAVKAGAEAIQDAGGTGTVLLSPACASFDMFKNFEDRGDQFRQMVREYLGG